MKLDVTITPASGQFEISENDSVVATGRITTLTEPGMSDDECPVPVPNGQPLPLSSDDIYKELRLRGYEYGAAFRGILSTDGTGNYCWWREKNAINTNLLYALSTLQFLKVLTYAVSSRVVTDVFCIWRV